MAAHIPALTDVLAHAGIGTLFACTGACTRKICKHTMTKWVLGGALIAVEATAITAVIG